MTWDNQTLKMKDGSTRKTTGPLTSLGAVVLITGILATGTHAVAERRFVQADQTRAGFSGELWTREDRKTLSTSSVILQIRKLSGLTWEELAGLFNVSRRSVHNWAEGKTLSSENERSLRTVLDVVKIINQGSVDQTRSVLLDEQNGNSLYSVMRSGDFAKAREYTSSINPMKRRNTPLSDAAKKSREPDAPALMALNDRVETIQKDSTYRFEPFKPKK